jgi:hypothetical protein
MSQIVSINNTRLIVERNGTIVCELILPDEDLEDERIIQKSIKHLQPGEYVVRAGCGKKWRIINKDFLKFFADV